ncbi:MAG: YdcF family protein [Flavitalea sp.]
MNLQFTRSLFFMMVSVTAMIIQACSFSDKTTKRLFIESSNQSFDIIIVPGVPFENGQWSRTMKARVYWSKFLYDRGIARNVMYSGSSVYTPYYEAEIMASYAQSLGIPKDHIYTETKAEHSTENIYYSYRKAKLLGFKTMALASDPFQTKLLKKFTRKRVSPEVKLIPFVIDSLQLIEQQMIDPKIDHQLAYNQDFISITKRENFWKRFRGTRGRNLDTTAYRP